MRTTGRLVDACKTLSGKFRLTFEVDDDVSEFVNKAGRENIHHKHLSPGPRGQAPQEKQEFIS